MTLPEAWVPSWAMDVAAVIAAAPSPPRRPDLAAAKALMLRGLASLWVGFAATGAAAVTVAAYGYGEASPVFRVLAETTVRATVLALLLASFAMVLVRRAAVCDAGFWEELIRHGQVCMHAFRWRELSFVSLIRESVPCLSRSLCGNRSGSAESGGGGGGETRIRSSTRHLICSAGRCSALVCSCSVAGAARSAQGRGRARRS